MAKEIERKYLVHADLWQEALQSGKLIGTPYRQGYLARLPGRTIRVRMAGENGYLTIKGAATGIVRDEFEYPIPSEDAEAMLGMCEGEVVEKRRFRVPYEGMVWEVDVFERTNHGLVVAEIELPSAEAPFAVPAWAGREVSGVRRYYNSELSFRPYAAWSDEEKAGE